MTDWIINEAFVWEFGNDRIGTFELNVPRGVYFRLTVLSASESVPICGIYKSGVCSELVAEMFSCFSDPPFGPVLAPQPRYVHGSPRFCYESQTRLRTVSVQGLWGRPRFPFRASEGEGPRKGKSEAAEEKRLAGRWGRLGRGSARLAEWIVPEQADPQVVWDLTAGLLFALPQPQLPRP